MKTFCPMCEKETDCHFDAELYSCHECGEDFASYEKPQYTALRAENERLREALDEAYTLLNPLSVDGTEDEIGLPDEEWELRYQKWMQQYDALKGGQK